MIGENFTENYIISKTFEENQQKEGIPLDIWLRGLNLESFLTLDPSMDTLNSVTFLGPTILICALIIFALLKLLEIKSYYCFKKWV